MQTEKLRNYFRNQNNMVMYDLVRLKQNNENLIKDFEKGLKSPSSEDRFFNGLLNGNISAYYSINKEIGKIINSFLEDEGIDIENDL